MVPDRKFAAAVAAAWGFVMLSAPGSAGADPAVDIPVPPAQPAIDSPVPAAAEPSADPAVALADSAAAPAGPPLDTGLVMSGPPGVAQLLDGRTLTVVAKDETQLPVAPLTPFRKSFPTRLPPALAGWVAAALGARVVLVAPFGAALGAAVAFGTLVVFGAGLGGVAALVGCGTGRAATVGEGLGLVTAGFG